MAYFPLLFISFQEPLPGTSGIIFAQAEEGQEIEESCVDIDKEEKEVDGEKGAKERRGREGAHRRREREGT